MKIDIFEDMKDCIGCNDVSDLPYHKREVCRLCCYNGNTGNEERK